MVDEAKDKDEDEVEVKDWDQVDDLVEDKFQSEDDEDIFETITKEVKDDLGSGKIGRRVKVYVDEILARIQKSKTSTPSSVARKVLDLIKPEYETAEKKIEKLEEEVEDLSGQLTDLQDLPDLEPAITVGLRNLNAGSPGDGDVARFLSELGDAFEQSHPELGELLQTAARHLY